MLGGVGKVIIAKNGDEGSLRSLSMKEGWPSIGYDDHWYRLVSTVDRYKGWNFL